MSHRKFYYSLLSSVFLLGSTTVLLAMEDQDKSNSPHPSLTLSSEDSEELLLNLHNLSVASEEEEYDSESEEEESEEAYFARAELLAEQKKKQQSLRAIRKLEDLKLRYPPHGLIPAAELALKRGAGYVNVCFLSSTLFSSGGTSQIDAAVGGTISDPNPCSESLLKEIKRGFKVLDIGCSYGIQIFPLLHEGADVVANDSDAFSLQALANSLKPEDLKNVHISCGKFPEETSFPSDYFDAVTMYYVMHYMEPKEIRSSFKKIHEILKPNGKVYITTLTPHSGNFLWYRDGALQNLSEGHEWPGEIADRAQLWAKVTKQPEENVPDKELPNYMHPQFPQILEREASYAGFRVTECGYCCLDDEEKRLLQSYGNTTELQLPDYIGKTAAYLIAEKK